MESRTIGPYRIEDQLGTGGMGEVYRAYDARLDRRVAIKLIRPAVLANHEARRRFRREAKAAASLSHPAIVQIHDILEHEQGDGIVMELVDGQSLSRLLDQGPLGIPKAVRLAREIADGLTAAHAEGIIHRDLKADNVMVTASGHAKILDFGLAKRLINEDSHLSVDGKILGTVHAMSPEQAQGFEVDVRSDLFSLGSLLYQMVTCCSPFKTDSPMQTLTRVTSYRQLPAKEVNPRVPAALSDLIDQLLEKDPAHRPEMAGNVVAMLEAITVKDTDPGETGSADAGSPFLSPQPKATSSKRGSESEALSPGPNSGLSGDETLLLPSSPARHVSGSTGRRTGIVALSIFFLLAALLGIWKLRPEAQPLYVAVLAPQVTAAVNQEETVLVASAVRLALIQGLLSRRGLSTPAPDEVDAVSGASPHVAQALGVDEVITSTLACGTQTCQIALQTINAADGTVRWSDLFKVSPDDLLDLTSAVRQRLHRGYSEFSVRPGFEDLDVTAEDYETYLRLRRDWETRLESSSPSVLLVAVKALEKTSPGFTEAYLLEARIAQGLFIGSRRLEDLERALGAVQKARELAPGDSRPLFELFNIALDGNRLAIAESAHEDLRRAEPGHGRILAQQALLLEARGQSRQALALMRTAVERHASRRNLSDLTRLEIRLGEHAAASEHLRELLRRSPDNFVTTFQLANHEMTYGTLEQAIELFEKLRKRSPTDLGLQLNIALCHFGMARYAEASRWFSNILEQDPGHVRAASALALTDHLAGRVTAAQLAADQALKLTADADGVSDVERQFLRAMALIPLGFDEQAVAAVQRMVPTAHQSPFAAWQAALIYAAVGETLSAKTKAREALQQDLAPQWFCAPIFDFLRQDPDFRTLPQANLER